VAVRPIRVFGDPILRSPTDPIEPTGERAQTIVADLIDTVKLPGRAGVAANQIGVGFRIFVYNIDGAIGYLINPTMVSVSGEPELMTEGCLSVPDFSFPRRRYPRATARGYLLDGSEIEVSGEGLLAQALQHELDHLDGVLYVEGLDPDVKAEAFRRIRDADWFRGHASPSS
jgi:peptide deformylase